MKLQSVNIKNFRCFEDITLDFHERLTVLVGGNGSGKSAVLDAIAPELASVACACIKQPNFYYNSNVILLKDIHKKNKENLPNFKFFFSTNIPTHHVFLDFTARATLQLNDGGDVFYSDLANNKKELTNNAIFVYYPTKRLVDSTHFNKLTALTTLSDAYKNMLGQKIDVQASLAWFDSKDAEQARERDERRELGNKENYTILELKAVKKAIESVLKDYINPRMKGTPPELVVSEKDNPKNIISLAQLSDGYRTMLGLVMDLASRMAIANAEEYNKSKKSVLESPAIVLIDEVDLHLHPSWQQRVLPDLMRTFPNTQFIVTTHSPQVISSVAHEHIRVLEDGKVYDAKYGTLGASSARVLGDIFDVDSRPNTIFLDNEEPAYPLKANIEKYFSYIDKKEYNTAEAKALRAELDEILVDDPMLRSADAEIERAERFAAWSKDNA